PSETRLFGNGTYSYIGFKHSLNFARLWGLGFLRPFSEWYSDYNVSTFSPSHFYRISPSFKRFMLLSIPFLLFLFQHHLFEKAERSSHPAGGSRCQPERGK
ncbi:hypothetical protein, partial [Ruthenibacterium sp.]|uniref:hypothetical protein n=1 Tax=Ruthenibacterium sp. TaxID=1905345 RepID=UPI002580DAD8